MIDLYLLEQLDAFARFGTLSRAAEEVHVSQPAPTHSMKRLEEKMGIALFYRDKRRLSLNSAGKVVAEYARRILTDEQEMLARAYEVDRRERTLTLGSCGIMTINHLVPVLTQSFPGKSILTEVSTDEVLLTKLRNRGCNLAVLHEKSEGKDLFQQRYLTEQIMISVPLDHPLSGKEELTREDLAGCSILTFDVGFWVERFKREMPQTAFLLQMDVDTMDELVESSNLLVFNSDQMLRDGYVPHSRKNIPLREDFAVTTYTVACLDSERVRYSSFFNAIRSESIQGDVPGG